MGIAVGIDLGTSNSVVARVHEGTAEVIADADGVRIHPSMVAFGYGRSVVVGTKAREQLTYAPENTVFSAKRLMGRRYNSEEVERMRRVVPWGIAPGPHGDARIRVQGRVLAVPEVSAHILAHLKQVAEEATGDVVDGAVITVPAYFNDQQRQATRDAAKIAGLECLRIINEPTAAALAYGFGQGRRQHVAVYDLGGGTFDISILRLDDDLFEVISTSGDTFLGGDDFDEAITMLLVEELEQQTGRSDLQANKAVMLRLRIAAEQAKRALSDTEMVDVRVPSVLKDDNGEAVHLVTRLDRNQVRQRVMPLIQRTFVVCDDALSQAGLTSVQIDAVLLVGGMTRYPLVRESVGHYFGKRPFGHINPDEVVSLGAAIQASSLTSFTDAPNAVLLDVTPQSLGVRTAGGFVEPLIPRNSPIPTQQSKIFHTAHDQQTEVRIQVFQGESRMASDNDLLGEFIMEGLRPAPRGAVRIEVTFAIDADGIVHVTAEDRETNTAQSLRIEASSRLSQDEVEHMRFDELGF